MQAGNGSRGRGLLLDARSAYILAPLIPALAGAVLLAATGPALMTTLAGALLIWAGLISGRWISRRHETEIASGRREHDADIHRLTNLYSACSAVWIRQLDTVRSEADTEVAQLARSFGVIAGKLDKAIGPSRFTAEGAHPEIVTSMERNAGELEKLVAALRLLQSSKQRVVDDIGAEADQLRHNASDIRQIAMHSRMVSLNATIEAARAGQAGKPFAVIVADMRELALRTAAASELFSRHTERLHAMVSAAFQEQPDEKVVSIAGAEAMVSQVVASSEATMRLLVREIATMEDERNTVRDDVSRVLVSLQFQDRASQILSHITTNLKEMRIHVAGAGPRESLDDQAWLDRMARDYSTHEEFRNHGGNAAGAVHDGPEVTFF